jgi:hypothetical protein
MKASITVIYYMKSGIHALLYDFLTPLMPKTVFSHTLGLSFYQSKTPNSDIGTKEYKNIGLG